MASKLKIGLGLAFVILVILVCTVVILSYSTSTIAADQKRNADDESKWGYKFETYRFGSSSRLIIWNRLSNGRYRTSLSYEIPTYFDPPRMIESRWLSNDTAIYLNFTNNFADSLRQQSSVKLIYDFETGNMYVSPDAQMWARINPPKMGSNPMTPSEFEQKLNSMTKRDK